MSTSADEYPVWLIEWMEKQQVNLWGVADLQNLSAPSDPAGHAFPFAVSFAIPMNPQIMAGIQQGPNQEYADAYTRVNNRINTLATALAAEIRNRGAQALPLAASDRTDKVNIKGAFPHKTAATRAGLGWIGRHCQLITRQFGSWVRLGTIFTDMALPCGTAMEKNLCGRCMRCVEECPAQALKGAKWYPGLPREEILDVRACDQWKKKYYYQYHKGHVCGICSAVCPHGLKVLKRMSRRHDV